MKCPFCNREFDEQAARGACKACAMFGGCHNLRCPHCGYETPAETPLVKAFRRWRQRKHDRSKS